MTKTHKLVIWLVITAFLAGFFWLWAYELLQGSLFESNNLHLRMWAALTVLVGFVSAGFILFQRYLFALFAGMLAGLSFMFFFGINPLNFISSAAILLLFFHAQANIKEELAQRTKINARMAIRRSVMPLILSVFLLVSFGAYQSPAIKSFENINRLPSSSEKFISTIVGAVVRDFAGGALDPSLESQATDQVSRQLIDQANVFLEPYFQYAPPAIAFALFLILWGLSWIFIWLSLASGVIFFYMFKKMRWFRIEEKDVKAEVLTV